MSVYRHMYLYVFTCIFDLCQYEPQSKDSKFVISTKSLLCVCISSLNITKCMKPLPTDTQLNDNIGILEGGGIMILGFFCTCFSNLN